MFDLIESIDQEDVENEIVSSEKENPKETFETFIDRLFEQEGAIHTDAYYSSLLDSLHLEGSREEDLFSDPHIESEPTDQRSPYLYMKGGIPAAKLKKTLLNKNGVINITSSLNHRNQELQQRSLERELQRTYFLCDREAKEKMKARQMNLNVAALDRVKVQYRLSPRERLIEKQLLAPYRHNKNLVDQLMDRYKQQRQDRKNLFQKADERKSDSEVRKAEPLRERWKLVKERRDMMIAQELLDLKASQREKEYRVTRVLENLSKSSQTQRQHQWATIVSTLAKLLVLQRKVNVVREAKTRDIVSWRATKTIQRAWRRYSRPPTVAKEKPSLLAKMKVAAGNKDSQDVFAQRVEAVSLVARFLHFYYVPGKVWSYLRKVRRLQRFARIHRVINDCRVLLLERFLQECLLPLALQIPIIVANKGLDLSHSMTTFETNNMKHSLHRLSSSITHQKGGTKGLSILPRMFSDFFSPDFHSLLRSKVKKLVEFQREFLGFLSPQSQPSYLSFSSFEEQFAKLWKDHPLLKRRLLFAFLIQKRQSFLAHLHEREPLQVIPPSVSAAEAMNFIKGGDDPLVRHLASIDQQILNWQERRAKPIYPFRRRPPVVEEKIELSTSEDGEVWTCPIFLLLSSITAADVLTFFLELGDLIIQFSSAQKEKRGKAERFGLLSVHRRLSLAMVDAEEMSRAIHSSNAHSDGGSLGSAPTSLPARTSQRKTITFVKKLEESQSEERSVVHRNSGSGSSSRALSGAPPSSHPLPPQQANRRSVISTRKTIHKLAQTAVLPNGN